MVDEACTMNIMTPRTTSFKRQLTASMQILDLCEWKHAITELTESDFIMTSATAYSLATDNGYIADPTLCATVQV